MSSDIDSLVTHSQKNNPMKSIEIQYHFHFPMIFPWFSCQQPLPFFPPQATATAWRDATQGISEGILQGLNGPKPKDLGRQKTPSGHDTFFSHRH